MDYYKLNKGWNADPNAPEPAVEIRDGKVRLRFYLNYFLFHRFKEGDSGVLTFYDCHKYSLNSMNDEGYFRGQYRYKNDELPWGEFYLLETTWENDFANDSIILNPISDRETLNHYIFFFRDNVFECVAKNFSISLADIQEQAQREFESCQKELLNIIEHEQYNSLLLNWVHDKSKAGFSKQQIYNILMELFKDIQTRPDPTDKLYDRVADFCDGFTVWGKSFQVLPDEPHVEDF